MVNVIDFVMNCTIAEVQTIVTAGQQRLDSVEETKALEIAKLDADLVAKYGYTLKKNKKVDLDAPCDSCCAKGKLCFRHSDTGWKFKCEDAWKVKADAEKKPTKKANVLKIAK